MNEHCGEIVHPLGIQVQGSLLTGEELQEAGKYKDHSKVFSQQLRLLSYTTIT